MRKVLQILKFDLMQGIVRRWYVYVLAVAAAAFWAMDSRLSLWWETGHPGMLDMMVYALQGMEEYVPQKGVTFEVPFRYMTMFGLMGLSASQYACREWKDRGRLYLLLYGDKRIWWFGKCVWSLCNTLLLYVAGVLTFWLVAAIGGNGSMAVSPSLSENLKIPLMYQDSKTIALYILVLGGITVTALSQLQVTLQVLFSPVLGFIIYMAVLISSVYYMSPYFMGNSLMLLRTRLFTEEGISLVPGIMIGVTVWVASAILGMILVNRKDVL